MVAVVLKVDGTICKDIHGSSSVDRRLWKSNIKNSSVELVPSRVIDVNAEEAIAQENWDDDFIDGKVHNWLKEHVHQSLGGVLKEICEPANDSDHKVTREVNRRRPQVKVGVEEVDFRSPSMRVCLKGESVVQICILQIDINIEAVLERPEEAAEELEMNVPGL